MVSWTATGIEGAAKHLDHRYRAGRAGWKKLPVRSTTEMIVGGVTGWVSAPQSVLVGRPDRRGKLRYEDRSVGHDRRAAGRSPQ